MKRDWQLVVGAIAASCAAVVTAVAIIVVALGGDLLKPALVAIAVDATVLAMLIAGVRA